MKNSKKLIAGIFSIVLIVSSLSGCGKKEEEQEHSYELEISDSTTTTTVEETMPPVTIADSFADVNDIAEEAAGSEGADVCKRTVIDEGDVITIADAGLAAYNSCNYGDMYDYTDSYLTLVATGNNSITREKYIEYGSNHSVGSNEDGFSYLLEEVKKDTDNCQHYLNAIQSLLENGEIKGVTPEDAIIDDIWEITGVYGELVDSVYVLHINGEWRIDTFFRPYVMAKKEAERAEAEAEAEQAYIITTTLHTYSPDSRPDEYFIDEDGNEW